MTAAGFGYPRRAATEDPVGRTVLYRVKIGEDEYIGTAEEVVGFMAQNVGAPGHDVETYMRGIAIRLRETMGIVGIETTDAVSFLETLRLENVLPVEEVGEPSEVRHDPEEVLGEGPVVYGPGVDPGDLD